jgi:hypothetical protein
VQGQADVSEELAVGEQEACKGYSVWREPTMPDAPISLFISYAHADSAFVDRLEADLRKLGFDPWDYALSRCRKFAYSVILDCQAFLVLSRNSHSSAAKEH